MSSYESVRYYESKVRVDKIDCKSSIRRVGERQYEGESRLIITSTSEKHRNHRKKIDAIKYKVTQKDRSIRYDVRKNNRNIYE